MKLFLPCIWDKRIMTDAYLPGHLREHNYVGHLDAPPVGDPPEWDYNQAPLLIHPSRGPSESPTPAPRPASPQSLTLEPICSSPAPLSLPSLSALGLLSYQPEVVEEWGRYK